MFILILSPQNINFRNNCAIIFTVLKKVLYRNITVIKIWFRVQPLLVKNLSFTYIYLLVTVQEGSGEWWHLLWSNICENKSPVWMYGARVALLLHVERLPSESCQLPVTRMFRDVGSTTPAGKDDARGCAMLRAVGERSCRWIERMPQLEALSTDQLTMTKDVFHPGRGRRATDARDFFNTT